MFSIDEIHIIRLSLQSAIFGTLIGLPFALAIGWVLAKSTIKGKAILDTLVSFPLVVPPVVTGYILLLLIGRSGPIGAPIYNLLGWDITFTWLAAGLAAGIVSLPLMTRSIELAIASVNPKLELSARNLGAGPIRAFFSVTLPLAHRGILAGMVLGFARGLGEFGATIVVAGNIPNKTQTLSLAIFTNLQTGDNSSVIKLTICSLVIALITLTIHYRLIRHKSRVLYG